LKSSFSSKLECLEPEFMISRRLLLRLFITEYGTTLASLALLGTLLTGVLTFARERLFEYILIVLLWIQLELAYRQWWLEARRGRPVLTVVGTKREGDTLTLHIRNIGESPAFAVTVHAVVIPSKTYLQLHHLLLGKPSLIKHLFHRLGSHACKASGTWDSYIYLPPGGVEAFAVSLKELDPAGDLTALISICRADPLELFRVRRGSVLELQFPCDEVLSVRLLDGIHEGAYLASRFSIREDPPGILTVIPNMLRDIATYYRSYKHAVSKGV
jgi:hypothetical protein